MMSRVFLVLTAALLARVGLCQKALVIPNKTVAYTTVAVPLTRAFGEMGKSVGVKFEIDGSMAQEPVIFRLDGVPLKEVMDRVASMEGAEWKVVDGGFILFRSSDDVARLTAADGARRAAAVRKSIDERVARAEKEGRMTPEKAEAMAQTQIVLAKQYAAGASPLENGAVRSAQARAMPIARLFAQIMASFNAPDLAGLRPGGRYVFKAKPTSVQYELPPLNPSIFREFFDDSNLLNDTVNTDFGNAAGISNSLKPNALHLAYLPSQVQVAFEPRVGGDQVHVTMEVLDAQGQTLASATDTLAWDWNALVDRGRENQLQRGAISGGIKLGADTCNMANLELRGWNDLSSPALSPDLMARLALPTVHDPESFACSEIVLGLAAKSNINVVFLPTDGNEEFSLFGCRSGYISWDLFKLEMDREANTVVDIKDGWLTGKPISPLRTAFYRWPRPALETFTKSVLANGGASIDELANLVLTMPHGSGLEEASFYKRLLLPPQPATSGLASEEALRLWAGLSEKQKEAAANGGITLMRDQLDPEQRELASDFLYLGMGMISLEDSAIKGIPQEQLNDDFVAITSAEKTETFPTGIPAGASLEIKDSTFATCFYTTTDEHGHVQRSADPLDAIAATYAQTQRPDLFPDFASLPWNNLRVGSQRKVTIKLHVDGRYIVSQEIDESEIPSGTGVPFNKVRSILSSDELKRFDEEVARHLQFFKKHKKSDFDWANSDSPSSSPVAPPQR